jgi:uncharacterized membrane protein YoaK (UPF0700 family)
VAWLGALQHGHRPLHAVLIVLTFVTGLVDAVTYLGYGHVFAANMTGNVIVLGFALVGVGDISATASLVSLAAFLVGGILGARIARALERTRPRWVLTMLVVETLLLAGAAALSAGAQSVGGDHTVVGLLALAMGSRTVTVRRLGISDVSTTVLTSTLAALAAETQIPGNTFHAAGLRLASVVAMLLGAASGALMSGGGPARVLAVAVSLVLIVSAGYFVFLIFKRTAD